MLYPAGCCAVHGGGVGGKPELAIIEDLDEPFPFLKSS
jgi:hypothetical protein